MKFKHLHLIAVLSVDGSYLPIKFCLKKRQWQCAKHSGILKCAKSPGNARPRHRLIFIISSFSTQVLTVGWVLWKQTELLMSCDSLARPRGWVAVFKAGTRRWKVLWRLQRTARAHEPCSHSSEEEEKSVSLMLILWIPVYQQVNVLGILIPYSDLPRLVTTLLDQILFISLDVKKVHRGWQTDGVQFQFLFKKGIKNSIAQCFSLMRALFNSQASCSDTYKADLTALTFHRLTLYNLMTEFSANTSVMAVNLVSSLL